MFRSHAGAKGVAYRVQYEALESRFGPFDEVTRQYAGAAAALWVVWQTDSGAVEQAEHARQHGRGRRPGAQAVARLKKRAGLSWGSYDAALRRLEELSRSRPNTESPVDALARALGGRTT